MLMFTPLLMFLTLFTPVFITSEWACALALGWSQLWGKLVVDPSCAGMEKNEGLIVHDEIAFKKEKDIIFHLKY